MVLLMAEEITVYLCYLYKKFSNRFADLASWERSQIVLHTHDGKNYLVEIGMDGLGSRDYDFCCKYILI